MSTPTSQNYDADDYWGQAVTKLTGYPMPSRKGLFTGLSSKEKSPLFRMSLDKIGVQSVVDAAKQGSLKSSGQDYDLYFYSNKDGRVSMYHARLVFIGSFMSENGRSRGWSPMSPCPAASTRVRTATTSTSVPWASTWEGRGRPWLL